MVSYMIDKNLKPRLAKDIVWKEEGENGEIISLASYIGGPIRFLNPVATKIIKMSDGKHTIQEIIDQIMSTFENAALEGVEEDVFKFLKELEDKKIIEPLKN